MSSKDISRDDLLILLASIGVVLPEDNKMTAEQLNKRLGQALDTAQEIPDILENSVVNPAELSIWSSPKNKTLYESSQRGNLTELFTGDMHEPKKGSLSSKTDIFKEMRQSILSIAYACDMGIEQMLFRDAEDKWAIYIKILNTYQVKPDVPLFFFFYKELAPTATESTDKLKEEVVGKGQIAISTISDLERRTLLKLFSRNGKKIDQKLVKSAHNLLVQSGYHPSFVLPLCPLNMHDLGKLGDPGCDVCGKKNASRCVQCMMASYCSKECQKADWPTHKVSCKSTKGGTWNKITLSPPPSSLPFVSLVNRLDSRNKGTPTNASTPPPDAHGGKMFLAKFQLPLSSQGRSGDMLVYDRQRTFSLFWKRSSQPVLFHHAELMIGHKLKFYRWMKRTGDYDFEICLDRAPDQDPLW